MKVVAFTCPHVGSRVGLSFPDETSKRDPAFPVREQIYRLYRAATEGEAAKPDLLLVLGDLIEGQNRRSPGIGTWTTDLYEQCDMAVELLKMWKAKHIAIVYGSRYHIDAGGGMMAEEYIARKIGAMEYPNQGHVPEGRRNHAGWHWYLRLDGVTFHMQHHIGVSSVFHYRSTPLARQLLNVKLNNHLRHEIKNHKVSVVLRGHAHYYTGQEHSGSEGYVVPCWKALDDYLMSRGAVDIAPDLGYMTFEIKNGHVTHDKFLWGVEIVQSAPLTVLEGARIVPREAGALQEVEAEIATEIQG